MVMYGADIGELRALAAQFDRAADQLDGCRGALGGQVHSSPWAGADAARFKGDWSSQHAPRLNETAGRLREAARSLRRNADDQEKTSAVDGGPSAGLNHHSTAPGGGGGGGGWGDQPAGPTRNPWQQAVDALKESEVPGGLKPWEMAELGAKMGELMGAKVGWFSTLNTGLDVVDIGSGILDGNFQWDKIIHLGADGLGKSPNPVAKLAALNLHVWTDVVVEANKADFSAEGRATVGNYIVQHPTETIQVVGESVVEVGRRLVGWLPL